jgi:hypothetical protein
MNKSKIIYTVFFILCLLRLHSQESFGGTPMFFEASQRNDVWSFDSQTIKINKKIFDFINNDKEQNKADSIAKQYSFQKKQFYGLGLPLNIDFKKTATVINISDSGKLYLLELESTSAYALQIYFDRFKIPDGARMFIYDKNRTMFLGSFTHKNNFKNNRFGCQFIKGNSLIIEYYEPNKVDFEAELHMEHLVHVFSKSGPFSEKGSKDCEINVNCPLGYGWEKEKRSVAIILGNVLEDKSRVYYGFCTGTVLNNTQQDGTPYFLTANHCFYTKTDIFDWLILFNYETDNCNDDGSYLSYGLVFNSIFGGEVLSRDEDCSPHSDYALIKLNVSPKKLASYNVVYAGWERDEDKIKGSPYTVCIHHPAGDVKKISISRHTPIFTNRPLLSLAEGCPGNYPNSIGTYWRMKWSEGITEEGSSGAPLFNSDHKVIGQLLGGDSDCGDYFYGDYFGRFSYSYNHGKFARWLDPRNTKATSIGSYNPSGVNENCYNKIQDGNETGVDCGGNCPPCDWVTNNGWGSPNCNNGIKDVNETGIDCGGNCRPCGSGNQCIDCKKNGDETFVDCGGSCKPCEMSCTLNERYYSDYKENLPKATIVKEHIETKNGVSIKAGQNVYMRAGKSIIMKPNSFIDKGSVFTATIGDCDCIYSPCGIYGSTAFSPNGDGINDELCFMVLGYDRFECEIFNKYMRSIHKSSGYIYDNRMCVWSGGNYPSSTYYCILKLYNECAQLSKEFKLPVNLFKSKGINQNSLKYSNYIVELPIDSVDIDNTPTEMSIYPNPVGDILNINYVFESDKPLIQIVDDTGNILISKYYRTQNNIIEINVGNIPKGVYLINILDNKKNFVKKFIKK